MASEIPIAPPLKASITRPAAAPQVSIEAALKHNPHLWSAEELRAVFVVRQTDLQTLLNAVTSTSTAQVPQHQLITGHRGMGKSTLLQRLALAITDDAPTRANWLPLTFPEEQYTLSTLAELWRNVLDALADALEREHASTTELAAMDARINAIGEMPTAQAEVAALTEIQQWIAQHKRGLVLLIDSSDLLLHTVGQTERNRSEGKKTALWRLRKTLSHQPGLFWIGASYQALEADHSYQDAFHDFFALHELRTLTLAEMRTALLALAQRFGAGRGLVGAEAGAHMAQTLDANPARLAALRLLSGGNPRTTVTLYEMFTAGGDDSVQSDLTRLLDQMTPLYKARMEALSEQPRKILAHLMEHWHPMGIKELAAASGLPTSTLSGQLKRLQLDGMVETTRLDGGAKRSGYQASERLFNIWYLMRSGTRRLRQRLAWLVQFIQLWYSSDERQSLASQRADQHAHGDLNQPQQWEFSRALAYTLDDSGTRTGLELSLVRAVEQHCASTRKALSEVLGNYFELDGEDRVYQDAADYLTRFAALDALLLACPHAKTSDEKAQWVFAVKSSASLSLQEKERIANSAMTLNNLQYGELLKVFRDEIPLFSDEFSQSSCESLRLLISQGEFFPDCLNSELAYKQLSRLVDKQADTHRFALEFLLTQHHDKWASDALEQQIRLTPNDASLHNRLGNRLINLESYEKAKSAFRQAIALNDRYAHPWYGLGNLLKNNLKRYHEAEAAYRQAIALDDKYAAPWNALGNLLKDKLKRYDEAEAAYRQAIVLDEKFAYPWSNLGHLLQVHRKRHQEAETAYRQAIALDETLAYPWNGLAILLSTHFKRYDEAEVAYRKAIALDKKYVDPWIGLGNLLRDHFKRYDEAETAYRTAIAMDEKHPYPWVNLARLLAVLVRPVEAADAYRETLARLGTNTFFDINMGTQLVLQAHLWLANQDMAAKALLTLSSAAVRGEAYAFFRLREQCRECHVIGRGAVLLALMEASPDAGFLLPLSLGLRAAGSTTPEDAWAGSAPEVQSLAREVWQEITGSK